MKFINRSHPRLAVEPSVAVAQLGRWAQALFSDLALLLNGRILPDDQFDAEETELTFAGVPGTQVVAHGLKRTPDRVEVVRADVGGVVYASARSAADVTVATTAAGTYRIRIS